MSKLKINLTPGKTIVQERLTQRVKPVEQSKTMPNMVLSIKDTVNNALNGMLVMGYEPIYNRGQFRQFDNYENMTVQERMDLVKSFSREAKEDYDRLQADIQAKQAAEAASNIAKTIVTETQP